ncbi:caspase-3-like [Amphiura filiformis]|uniref:caspase-3-like n=1 Tax=Amphiura filiformis TaxID=82378 RepID=UPI003B2221BE
MYKEIEAISKRDVIRKLKSIATKSDLGDMLLLFVACHGSEDGIKCIDKSGKETFLDLEELRRIFYANHCQALIGKPKVFVYMNCRGNEIAKHISSSQRDLTKPSVVSSGSGVYSTEDPTDVLEIYGCGPYQKQYVVKKGASWLLIELCNVADHYPKRDLLAILTGVNNNIRKLSGNDHKEKVYGVGQQPIFTSTLTKEIFQKSAVPPDRLSIQDEDEENKLDQAVGGADPDDSQSQRLLSGNDQGTVSEGAHRVV